MTEQAKPRVLLTAIGKGPLEKAKYMFAGESEPREGELFPALLCDYLKEKGAPVQKAIILLTSGAKNDKKWLGDEQSKGLKAHLEERGIEIIEADIPNGNTEDELWQIFEAVGKIPQGAAVVLDVTHGFRSLPLVMLLAAAYRDTSGDFTLESVYYGAYTSPNRPRQPVVVQPVQPAEDQSTQPVISQAVELTPMLTLFEWASAVDAFKRSGSLRQMAELLERRHTALYRGKVVEKRARLPLKPLADQMTPLMDAIELGRLESMAEPVTKIGALADEVRVSAERWAKPFSTQIDKVLAQLDRFQISAGEEDVNKWLAAQFGLIEWYSENNFYIHASLLMREWVISYVISRSPEHSGKRAEDIYKDTDLREQVTRDLNSATRDRSALMDISKSAAELAQKLNALSPAFRSIVGLPSFELRIDETAAISGVWNELKELRNDVAHVGHRKQTFDATNIKKKVEKLIEALRPLVPSAAPSEPSSEPATPAE